MLERKDEGCIRSVEEVITKVSRAGATHAWSTEQQHASREAVQWAT